MLDGSVRLGEKKTTNLSEEERVEADLKLPGQGSRLEALRADSAQSPSAIAHPTSPQTADSLRAGRQWRGVSDCTRCCNTNKSDVEIVFFSNGPGNPLL